MSYQTVQGLPVHLEIAHWSPHIGSCLNCHPCRVSGLYKAAVTVPVLLLGEVTVGLVEPACKVRELGTGGVSVL